jgi:plasmid stabilization system protein ParE
VKKYRVIVPPIVQEQIRAQVRYIARDSIANALAWEDRLRAAVKDLGTLPTRNAIDKQASRRIGQDVRRMVLDKTYLVFYRIRESDRAVDILNFRHGARLK